MTEQPIGDLHVTRLEGAVELRVARPPLGTRVAFAIWLVIACPFLAASVFMTGLFLFMRGEWNLSIAPIWHVPIRVGAAAFFAFMAYIIWTGHILGNARDVFGARVVLERAGDQVLARQWIGRLRLRPKRLIPPLTCEGWVHQSSRLSGFSVRVRDSRGRTMSPGSMIMTGSVGQAKNLMKRAVPAVQEALDSL